MWKSLFPDIETADDVFRRAYHQLLDPLRAVCPEAQGAAMKAWQEGRPVGPALADGIRAWGEQIRAEGEETIEELNARIERGQRQLNGQAEDIDTLKKHLTETSKRTDYLRELIDEKTATIQAQNNLLVKQHEQFTRLLGSPKDE